MGTAKAGIAIQPTKVAIDDKASGTQLIQKLPPMAATVSRAASPRGTRSCERADGDDRERLRPHSRDRAMARPGSARNDRFQNRKHDNQVDPTAQFLAWSKRRPRANSCSSS
jgi:hypothetical protein